MNHITILLAEDHTVVRKRFRKILEFEKDLHVVCEVEDGLRAVAMVTIESSVQLTIV